MSWKEASLGQLCDDGGGEVKTGPFGSQLHQSDYADHGTPVVMPKDIIGGRVSEIGIARVGAEHVERLSHHRLSVGDIVYGRRGDIGRCALVTETEAGWLCGTGCLRVTLGEAEVDPQFLFYFLNHPDTVTWIFNQAVGATMPNLNTGILRSVPVRYPPLPTQQRIAAILSAYDDLIETNTRRIAILEEMARRLYEEWFVHFRFPGHEETEFDGDLPSGWSEVPLGTVANITWGDTKTTKKSYVDAGFVAYSAAGPDGFLPHFDYDRTGIVLSAIGANCGLTWFARGKWSCIKNTIRLFSNDQAVSDEYLFLTTGFSDYWPKRGAAQPFISQGDAKQCKVVVPPETLHERFLAVACPALKQADHLRLANANLRAQRDLVLPKLVLGEIDVSRAEAVLEAAE